ncbi:MAG: ATP-binding cassette domain-containing protein [Pseudomonadota bacterium]|jgi:iron complex transport system ATP-binding protein|uniref:ATP-binding cassette domain-containing protein n=1 Tax=Halomonadaceae TaxID=28256 RepID=UPI0005CBAFFF|nr:MULTISPECIES: ATP-binding cassette domain-containing protein [Halomonas]MED5458477.1 ATP-binding cassette domain-containing protein [Pseudomonadota bacterium]KJD19680.1 iron-hydroxamate transporter ATP-binding subunit [Halomonas meridiana]MCD1652433.1 ATP-binding cassette domain-containing protein [Halomonas axialensis]MCD2088753.1 ATP-binding cassette domain-containing protein [Halomonas meridiana]MEE3110725.1 ATP-binding cassette domain-containing protein [Pseudomonadota bacterium]
MFDVQGATFAINGKPLLQPIHHTFEEGKVYGLIGHNGSGKSTLIKLLAQQQPVSEGDIRFDQRPLQEWGNREFARQVAYLPQHLPSAENLTGRELVAFGRYPWHGLLGRHNQTDKEAIERAIALTHTEAFADRLVDTLSGGERQRVWLAMLIAQGSRFLLLDEPLAALDIAHQMEVLALIRKLCDELNLGVIIVLHDINMASRYCDELMALHSGRLLAHGKPDALMQNATLEAIYGLPMQVMQHPNGGHRIAVAQ